MLTKRVELELKEKMPWHHKMFDDYVNGDTSYSYVRNQISWAYGKVSEDAYRELYHIREGIIATKEMNRWLKK